MATIPVGINSKALTVRDDSKSCTRTVFNAKSSMFLEIELEVTTLYLIISYGVHVSSEPLLSPSEQPRHFVFHMRMWFVCSVLQLQQPVSDCSSMWNLLS